MTSKDIEELATNAVKKSILLSGTLSPYISENDKGPSWDGFVYLYRSEKKTKQDYCGRVPVQVKGTCCTDLSRASITHSVDTDDLRSYLCDGGVMFFVTCIAPDGSRDRIYYAALTTAVLQSLLDACTALQHSKSITLRPFPQEPGQKADIFRKFSREYRQAGQAAPKKPAFAHIGLQQCLLPSYWNGPDGVVSEDRLLDALTEKGVHILDLHYGNQIQQLVRRLRDERDCDSIAIPFDELTEKMVTAIQTHSDPQSILQQYFCGLGQVIFFRDLDLLSGRPATAAEIHHLLNELSARRSVILSGSYLRKAVPNLLKVFKTADYYEICQ